MVRRGTWNKRAAPPAPYLRGCTLGMIGMGRVGKAIVEKLSGFGMHVPAYDPHTDPARVQALGVQLVTLDELLKASDLVSIQCALTDETRGLIGHRELSQMRSHTVLVNIGRGPVVVEADLYRALSEGRIAGAALDVLEQEPPSAENPLLTLPNTIITPHMASMSDQFPQAIWVAICETIVDLTQHRYPKSVVNRTVNPQWPPAVPGM